MNSGVESEDRNEYSPSSIRLMRVLMGFLFAFALFLIEVGISEIVLGNDIQCRENARSSRLALDPYAACLPELVHYFFVVLNKGPFSILSYQIPNVGAWIVTGGFYGILGGFLAQFTPRIAAIIFLGIHLLILAVLTMLTFFANYIF
jgi:hypothetical protein